MLLLGVLGALPAGAVTLVVASHGGAADPVGEGFAEVASGGGVLVDGDLEPDGATGVDAWRVDDPTSTGELAYVRSLSTETAFTAWKSGFTLRARLRVPVAGDAPDAAVTVEFASASQRYRMEFGSDAGGNAQVAVNGGAPLTIPGALAYHRYELVYDASTQQAALRVDGGIESSGIAPEPGAFADRVRFGSTGDAELGTGHYARVELQYEASQPARGPAVFANLDDQPTPPASLPVLPPSAPVWLHAWVDAGSQASATGTACVDGDGDELCGFVAEIVAEGDVELLDFVAQPGVEHSLSGTRLGAAGLQATAPATGPRRIGAVSVRSTGPGGGSLRVRSGAVVQANLFEEEIVEQVIALPEPGGVLSLASGLAGLAALGRWRARRRRRRRGRVALLGAALLAWGAAAGAPAPAAAQPVYSHVGAGDPLAGGWSVEPGDDGSGVTLAGLAPDPVGGLDARLVADSGSGRYRYARVPQGVDLDLAAARGWTLRMVLRVGDVPADFPDAVDFSILGEYANGATRYMMWFGADADGDPIVNTHSGSFTLEGAGSTYHEYEMVFEPKSAQATLYVDGVARIGGITGVSGSLTRINWGSGQTNATGKGYYHRVEWAINQDSDEDDVPDWVDDCPWVQNNPNVDTAGVGAGSPPDGTGDACQCAELSGNGEVGPEDVALYLQHLADPDANPLDARQTSLCAVHGGVFACDLLSAVLVERAVAGLAPGIVQACGAATGYGVECGDGICTEGCWDAPRGCQDDCGKCETGTECVEDSDCASDLCLDGACAAPPTGGCGDGVCDPYETCSHIGLGACPDDCGPCLANADPALSDYCLQDADCDTGICDLVGKCDLSGTRCTIGPNELSEDCPGDEYCSVRATQTSIVGFEGVCSDLATTCDTGFTLFGLNQDVCAAGELCHRQSICHLPYQEGCGAPPTYAERCDNGESCLVNDQCKSGTCYDLLIPTGKNSVEILSYCSPPREDGAWPCVENADCAGGICNFGVCRSTTLPVGSLCFTDAACTSGRCELTCTDSFCGDGGCDASEDSGVSYPDSCPQDCGLRGDLKSCQVNGDCKSGYCGSPGPSCLPCRFANAGLCDIGDACDADVDCSGSNLCLSGYCAPEPPACSGSNRPDGCACSSNGDCASNRCVDPPGSAPPVCAPSGCVLPGGACWSNSACCDFPTVPMTCFGETPISPGICVEE